MKTFSSPSQKIGRIGENIACIYLRRKGFFVVERNYTKKWGEIDIIAEKSGVTHFVEVKSISCETGGYRPEEQVHHMKRSRLRRTIETYVLERSVGEWRFDLICVHMDHAARKAGVEFLEDLII